MPWSPEKIERMRSDPFQVLSRRHPILLAVFLFCLVLAADTIWRDCRGCAPGVASIKYPFALLMTASAFIGISVRRRRIEKAEESNNAVARDGL